MSDVPERLVSTVLLVPDELAQRMASACHQRVMTIATMTANERNVWQTAAAIAVSYFSERAKVAIDEYMAASPSDAGVVLH